MSTRVVSVDAAPKSFTGRPASLPAFNAIPIVSRLRPIRAAIANHTYLVAITGPNRIGTVLLVGDQISHVRLPDGTMLKGPRRVLLLVKPTIVVFDEASRLFPGLIPNHGKPAPAP